MKRNPNEKREGRNQRMYVLYKKGSYTYRGLGNLFRISGPRVFQIIQKEKKKENIKI